MALGRRRRRRQEDLFVATSEIRSSGNPFYETLNRLLEGNGFDGFELAAQLLHANIRFAELRRLLLRLGFDERIRGSHYIFTRDDIEEQVNLQDRRGAAKAYQVKQVRQIIRKYGLGRID